MGPKFQFLKKVYPTIFFTHKMCFTTFHVDWSQKIDKNFFALFFKKFYKLLSPYGTKISIFEKSVSDNFFHLQNMFHNISRWLKPKNRQKLFRTNSKFFTIYCPPMEPKFQLLKKVFPTIFFTYKTCFTTFHIDWSQKIDKNFFEPFFKKFYKLLSPYGTKISIFGKSVSDNFFHLQNKFHNISRWLMPKNWQKFFRTNFSKFFTSYCLPMGPKFQLLKKVFPTIFFTYKTCFTTFHNDWSQKIDKNFFEPFFQKSLQVVVPLWDQNFNFWKKCFRQFFSLTKQVSQHFTLIDAKKLTKIFSNQFKIFYNLLSPYGTKISTFEKSVSDNFFHLQNMFHNISRWLKPKNWQKFFRTNFSKFFTSYCPPMGPKFQFLKKVFPTIFFTYKTCFTTFHVDWSQKIDKNFFEPFFKKFYKLLSPYGTKISIFEKSVSDNFFHSQNVFHNISRWLKPKNRQKFFRTNSKFFTIYCPPMEPKFQLLKKVFPTIFFTYKTCFTTFHIDWSQKIDKNFFEPFFKKFYKLLSPYGTKMSIFGKSVSDNFFHLQNKFHNISRWLMPKNWQKFFRTNFSKFFTSYCLPMGPKFQLLKKVFPTIFFTYKTSFTTFHVDWCQKIDKNFFEPIQNFLQFIVPLWNQNFNFWKKCFRQFFSLTKHVSQHFTLIEAKKLTKIFSNQFFKIFYKLLSPYGTKISIFEKSVSDNFFHLQNMFHNISRWLKPKNWQKFFRTFFQKILQVILPLWDQNFNFWKKCFRQFFSLTKCVSQHFTLIEAKKSTKIFSNQFKIFYNLLSPYGTKISTFEKSVSDNFFHLQNMFHNISRW